MTSRPVFQITGLAVLGLLGLGPSALGQAKIALDQRELCLQCHDDLAEQMAAPVKHAPVMEGDCSACHNPHAARNESLLLERPAILCANCHPDVTQALNRSSPHPPAAEGKCGACHTPHGGQNQGLLHQPGLEMCSECHKQVDAWTSRPVQHQPFARDQCSTCHDPHGAEHPGLLSKPSGTGCFGCHSKTSDFRNRHSGYPVERADCQQCHDPHASDSRQLLNSVIHPPFASNPCSSCHQGSSAESPFALRTSESILCGECHSDQVEEARSAVFPHVAGGGSNCSACHNPHSGTDQSLLRNDLSSTCLTCHNPGGAKSGEEGSFLSHADGAVSCETCHRAHGGDRPLLLVADPIELCAECHSHQHAVAHPMGEEWLDPRNDQPIDCLSCHGIHRAPAPKYLHRDGERDLCIGCHKQQGGLP